VRAASGAASGASRRVTGFALAVLCLLLAGRIADVLSSGEPGQVPFTVALFVLPVLYAYPGTRRLLDHYRWPVLAVQAALTWVPFAIFGSSWQEGIGGLLAGLVLLMVPGRVSGVVAGGLLAAEVTGRAAGTGLPPGVPAWMGVLWVVAYYVDDALVFFGMVRLAQIVAEVEQARSQAAELAVSRERLHAARFLQAGVGQRLVDVAARTAAARRALSGDGALAREQIAAAAVTARDAVAQARSVTGGPGEPPAREPAAPSSAVIGARLAWAVLVAVLLMFVVENTGYVVALHYGTGVTALAVGDIALITALQLYHSAAGRQGRRPRAWPVTLALQVVLAYAFAFPFIWAYSGFLGPFVAGSILLLVPGRWRWAGYAAVVVSYSALYAVLPVRDGGPWIHLVFSYAAVTAGIGLMVYGLSWLAGLARELEGLRDQLAWMAAVRERLRVARDVHDLLGLGLSAVALKADLIGALIGRDEGRAAAEIEEMSRICATVRADLRLVTGDGKRLSLAAELAAAKQILSSAGIKVRASIPGGSLPAAADEVLAPVLREAVTNILRHAAATACVIEVSAYAGALRLHVGNDGAAQRGTEGGTAAAGGRAGTTAAGGRAGTGTAGGRAGTGTAGGRAGTGTAGGRAGTGTGGLGLANLDARVRAAGGRLATWQADGRFGLTAELPLDAGELLRLEPVKSGIDDPFAAGHGADGTDHVAGRVFLEQVAEHPGAQRGGQGVGRRRAGEDQYPAGRQPPGQLGGGGDAVGAGQADIQERDVGAVL
jgi:two-component system, NarL family, sensor histidine kinase DesK